MEATLNIIQDAALEQIAYTLQQWAASTPSPEEALELLRSAIEGAAKALRWLYSAAVLAVHSLMMVVAIAVLLMLLLVRVGLHCYRLLQASGVGQALVLAVPSRLPNWVTPGRQKPESFTQQIRAVFED